MNVSLFTVRNPGQFRLLELFMKRSEHYPDDQISYGFESLGGVLQAGFTFVTSVWHACVCSDDLVIFANGFWLLLNE